MTLNKKNQALLESDNITSSIIHISIPMMISGFTEALYNTIDSIFVGKYVGSLALAALAVNNAIQFFLMAVGSLFTVGVSSIISRALGAKNYQKVTDTFITGVFLSVVVTVSVSLIMLLNLDQILLFMGSPENVLAYSREFGRIILWGAFLTPLNALLYGTLRSQGIVYPVMYLVCLGAFLNVILDALFIIVFQWGVQGAALATILSQFIVFLGSWTIASQTYHIRFHMYHPKYISFSISKEIFVLGATNFLRVFVFSIVQIAANRAASVFGAGVVAAFGIVNRIMHLAYQPIFGSNLGTQSLIGYNYGANRYLKVRNIIIKSSTLATCLGIIPSIILFIAPESLFALFTNDAQIISYAQFGSRMVSFTFFLYGLQVFSTGSLVAMGHPKEAFIISLVRPCTMVLCLLVLPHVFGITGIWLTYPVTDIIGTLLCSIVMSRELYLLHKREDNIHKAF